MKTNSCPEPRHLALLGRTVQLHVPCHPFCTCCPQGWPAARVATGPHTAPQCMGSFGDSSHSPLCRPCHPSCSRELRKGRSSAGCCRAQARKAYLAAGGVFNLAEKAQQNSEAGAFLAGNKDNVNAQKPLAFLHPGPGIHPDLLAGAHREVHVLFSSLGLLKQYVLPSQLLSHPAVSLSPSSAQPDASPSACPWYPVSLLQERGATGGLFLPCECC